MTDLSAFQVKQKAKNKINNHKSLGLFTYLSFFFFICENEEV